MDTRIFLTVVRFGRGKPLLYQDACGAPSTAGQSATTGIWTKVTHQRLQREGPVIMAKSAARNYKNEIKTGKAEASSS